jgi:hypothetical protein
MGPKAGLDAVLRKIPSPRLESNPGHTIIQPVASCYTEWTFPARSPGFDPKLVPLILK